MYCNCLDFFKISNHCKRYILTSGSSQTLKKQNICIKDEILATEKHNTPTTILLI